MSRGQTLAMDKHLLPLLRIFFFANGRNTSNQTLARTVGDIASLMNKAQVFPSSLTGNSEDATVQFFA